MSYGPSKRVFYEKSTAQAKKSKKKAKKGEVAEKTTNKAKNGQKNAKKWPIFHEKMAKKCQFFKKNIKN